jgi:hypothetical protein
MFDFEDPWWLVAVLVLVGCWVVGVAVPVQMAAAPLQPLRQYADLAEDATDDQPPPVRKPGLGLPVLAFVASLAMAAISLRKRIQEPEGGNRWVWMATAQGAGCFWAFILILWVMKVSGRGG